MSVDVTKLKPGVTVTLKDGSVVEIKGSFMSNDGLVLTSKPSIGSIVSRNIPLTDIVSIAG